MNLTHHGASGTAKRLRQTAESTPAKTVMMKLVVCTQCGERFAIGHDTASPDAELAERQAKWLEDQFVWDHIQESKHRSSIALPSWDEMK